MSSQLALAAQLSQLDRAELETLLRSRIVANPAAIRDSLDLAATLLKPESIRRALAALPVTALAMLLSGSSSPKTPPLLTALALRSDDGQVSALPEVNEILTALLDQAGLSAGDLREQPDATPERMDVHPAAEHAREHVAAEHAFETVRAVNLMLRAIAAEPVAMRSSMSPSAASIKKLGAAIALEQEQTVAYFRLLLNSALVHASATRCTVTDSAREWSSWTRPERFAQVAQEWVSRLAPYLRGTFARLNDQGTTDAHAVLHQLYPLAPADYAAHLDEALADATLFGLVVDGELSTIGQDLFAGEHGAARARLELAFPSSVGHVYVQPDLSVIAPGPLDPIVEEGLLNFATLESAGLASSYRITSRTLEAALSAGHDEPEIREFLAKYSLTGIPQPLDYLLVEATKRHGAIVVRDAAADADGRSRTLIWCQDPAVAAQLRVDRALTSLSFAVLSGSELVTVFEPTQVADALRDAGYAITVEATKLLSTTAAPVALPTDLITELADRVFAASQNEAAGGSIERLLELAVRQKQRIRAVLSQPDGTVREFQLRPVGLSNGRLRGIDEQAEVERTLPVSHLIEVEHLTDEPR